jgi:HSP20 family molecular chaperone IbpA
VNDDEKFSVSVQVKGFSTSDLKVRIDDGDVIVQSTNHDVDVSRLNERKILIL